MKSSFWQKAWTFLAGMGSTIIMVLAFFIPSIQDQWDRNESRKIINQYEQLGDELFDEQRFDMAEQAYRRAFELSDSRRLDLEMKRLNANINRINMNPNWGAEPPEDLEEADYQYVLHMQTGNEHIKERVNTLNSYGLFLVSKKKITEAEAAFKEAIELNPQNELAYINLGNLYDQLNKKEMALHFYEKAIALDKNNIQAFYNLGLLYAEMGNYPAAKIQFSSALKLDSTNADVKKEYSYVMEKLGEQQ